MAKKSLDDLCWKNLGVGIDDLPDDQATELRRAYDEDEDLEDLFEDVRNDVLL